MPSKRPTDPKTKARYDRKSKNKGKAPTGFVPPKRVAGKLYCDQPTRAGTLCPQRASVVTIRGKRYQLKTCVFHASPAIKKELGVDGFKKGGPGSPGRKPVYTATEILRKRFEEDARRYLEPLEESLEAMRAVVVGNGASAHVQMVNDFGTRLKALEMLLDRIYGKPRQVQEITGGDEAIEISIPQSEERSREVATILAESGALGAMLPKNPSASAPSTN